MLSSEMSLFGFLLDIAKWETLLSTVIVDGCTKDKNEIRLPNNVKSISFCSLFCRREKCETRILHFSRTPVWHLSRANNALFSCYIPFMQHTHTQLVVYFCFIFVCYFSFHPFLSMVLSFSASLFLPVSYDCTHTPHTRTHTSFYFLSYSMQHQNLTLFRSTSLFFQFYHTLHLQQQCHVTTFNSIFYHQFCLQNHHICF